MFTTTLKTPCGECPYRKGTREEDYVTLGGAKDDYDGSIVHRCHKLSKNYTLYEDNLGCLGSKQWGEKLLNNDLHPHLKEITELE